MQDFYQPYVPQFNNGTTPEGFLVSGLLRRLPRHPRSVSESRDAEPPSQPESGLLVKSTVGSSRISNLLVP